MAGNRAVLPAVRVSVAEGLRGWVLAGPGIGMGSAQMFTPELASGAVRQAVPEWELPSVDVWDDVARRPQADPAGAGVFGVVQGVLRRADADRRR